MTVATFTVVSESSSENYALTALMSGERLLFTCTCIAGSRGQLCKHRLALLAGKSESAKDPDPKSTELLAQWTAASSFPEKLQSLKLAEHEVELAKKRVTILKAELGRLLDSGI